MSQHTGPALRIARLRRVMSAAAFAAALLLSAVTALWSATAAQGILMGAAAAILPFWLFAKRVEALARRGSSGFDTLTLGFSGFRVLLYLAALLGGHFLDPATIHGVLGATAGIFAVQGLLAAFTLAGFDLPGNGAGH